ncbi:hypothetical protein [Desulfobacula phenolica]|uniref:hypothetical protein n=1 Tax=Desulfobacula phenolica TaxID=90732 RepID=UPI000B812144|nr:hypothetical protein [Desulfobacula phenolica]
MAVYMKVFKNPNSDFHVLLWANLSERPGLPLAVIQEIWNLFTLFQNTGNADMEFSGYEGDNRSGYQ